MEIRPTGYLATCVALAFERLEFSTISRAKFLERAIQPCSAGHIRQNQPIDHLVLIRNNPGHVLRCHPFGEQQ